MAAVPSQSPAAHVAATPTALAERLYEAYSGRVLAYCRTCLRSWEEAEDAAQTTFLHAVRALARGVVPEAEAPWLLALARNVCLTRQRSRGRRRERETPRDPLALQDACIAPEPSVRLDGIEEALAGLPEPQRRAILLREWRGLAYREIAEELGVSRAAAEALIFRARRTLAARLEGERPPVARRALGGLQLGLAAAWLKPLLPGGLAAKVTVGAATLATVAVVAGERLPGPGEAPAPAPARSVPAPAPAPDAAEVRLQPAPEDPTRAEVKPEPKRPRTTARGGSSPDSPRAQRLPAPGVAPVGDPVAAVTETAGVEAPALPAPPEVERPALPDELPVAPELPAQEVSAPELAAPGPAAPELAAPELAAPDLPEALP